MAAACTGNRLQSILNCRRGCFAEKEITEHQDGGQQIGPPEDPVSQFIPQDAGLTAPIHQERGDEKHREYQAAGQITHHDDEKMRPLRPGETGFEQRVIPEEEAHGIQAPLKALTIDPGQGCGGQAPGQGVRIVNSPPAPARQFIGRGEIFQQVPGGESTHLRRARRRYTTPEPQEITALAWPLFNWMVS